MLETCVFIYMYDPSHHKIHLVIGCSEPPPDILVIKYLYLKTEVLLEVLDDHNQEWKLNTKSSRWVRRTSDVCCADVSAHDLQH